jgi:hypothetical protein
MPIEQLTWLDVALPLEQDTEEYQPTEEELEEFYN